MDSIVNGINNLLAWLGNLPQWFLDVLKALLQATADMLVDLFCIILDGLYQGVIALLALIPVSQSLNSTSLLAGAPAEFIGMLVAIRVPEGLAIIVIALTIRFLLGLIPFIRVGG